MPPKRVTRRAGATPQRPHQEPEFESILDRAQGPVLPSVPVQASFNYGAATTTGLPQRMSMRPNIGIDQMAGTVNAHLEVARKRTAATKKKQDPRHANEHSDKTPSPPVPHSVSTDSSPDAQPPLQRHLSNSPLYPSPLQRMGSPRIHSPLGSSSPFRHSSVDNASVASWNLERDINEDDLQRTRPSKHGRNITAPLEEFLAWLMFSRRTKRIFLRRWLGAARSRRQGPQSNHENELPSEVRRKSWMQKFEAAMEGPYQNWIRAAFYLFLFLSFIFVP
ncbi:unnamed protein product [Penicillium nalgiovense]|nr:unnamed protein product [Penicillium nalgiovense]